MDVWVAAYCHGVESDLAGLDIDEAFVAPGLAPLVLAHPEQAAVLLVVPPADHLYRVAAHHLASYVRVRPVLVGREVLVDRETHHERAVLKKLTLDFMVVREYFQRTCLAIVLSILLRRL